MSEGIFRADPVHRGQYRRYDDTYYVWNVATKASREETLEWCFSHLHKRLPSYEEWQKLTENPLTTDWSAYFDGYYKMHHTPDGYQFTVCEPYCD